MGFAIQNAELKEQNKVLEEQLNQLQEQIAMVMEELQEQKNRRRLPKREPITA